MPHLITRTINVQIIKNKNTPHPKMLNAAYLCNFCLWLWWLSTQYVWARCNLINPSHLVLAIQSASCFISSSYPVSLVLKAAQSEQCNGTPPCSDNWSRPSLYWCQYKDTCDRLHVHVAWWSEEKTIQNPKDLSWGKNRTVFNIVKSP